MLATQRMSSHGGQQNFPFGCMHPIGSSNTYTGPYAEDMIIDQPESIHGLGLPDFMNPGPPPGQPLLNAHENQDLDNFLSGFDSAAVQKHGTQTPFHMAPGQEPYWNMPPTFVGSETSLGARAGVDPHQLQMADGFMFEDATVLAGHDMHPMGQGNALDNGIHGAGYGETAYSNILVSQLQSAAAQIQPGYGPGWPPPPPPPQQSYGHQGMVHMPSSTGTVMRFGSDSHFQPTGYAAPNGVNDPDMIHPIHPMDWFEPSSATTTQPNTQPNTQPSSPTWSKKRKLDEFHQDQPSRNGFMPPSNGHPANASQPSPPNSNPRRHRQSVVKTEQHTSISQPPTPRSNSKPQTPLDPEIAPDPGAETNAHDEDAEAEDDEELAAAADQARTPSPAPWPGSKSRPPKSSQRPPSTKAGRDRRKPSIATTPIKPKSRPPRTSSSSQPARVPLTQEQKKANHTNSEQRRRDATARAYAELYDLVPELDEMGKQSTMKKLELVVAKVQRVRRAVEGLRTRLGLDPATGRPLNPGASGGAGLMMHSDADVGAVGWHP